MHLTQNDRIKQVTTDTMVVGVDIGEETHYCRAFDWMGVEFSAKAFKFSNTSGGFHTFLLWSRELMQRHGKSKILVGCEPTGCYWLTFQRYLKKQNIQLVVVNPYSVHKAKELDDNSPEKDDQKDPKTIAGLVREGRYSISYIPEGIYSEIREASRCRDRLMKDHVRLSNQIQEWLQKYFPEYLECYAKYDSASGITLLEEAPLPEDILRLGVTGIVQVWRDRKCRKVGLKKAKELLEAAQESVGIPGGEAARLDISILVTDYQTNLKQLERVEALLEEDVRKVPNVEKLLAIKGVGLNSVEGFLAEVGDIGRFTDPKQIQKLAGLEITKISSGKRKGQPGISKRGRAKLRCVMYELARACLRCRNVRTAENCTYKVHPVLLTKKSKVAKIKDNLVQRKGLSGNGSNRSFHFG